jgi:hypothetical protein
MRLLSRDEYILEEITIKLKNKLLPVFIIVLCLPLATIISTNSWNIKEEIDFYVYLETPEKQAIIDEIVHKMECLGLIVNTVIFTDLYEWTIAGSIDMPDATYGGLSYTWFIDDIFTLSMILSLQKAHMFYGTYEDKKFDTLVDELWGMAQDAMVDPGIVTEEYLNTMIEIFQDIEKRLWNKKIILPFVQFIDFFPPWGMELVFTEVIITNSVKGRVFSNLGLRKALHRSIDRNVFLDYYAEYTPLTVWEVWHLYQMSIHHDANLPLN